LPRLYLVDSDELKTFNLFRWRETMTIQIKGDGLRIDDVHEVGRNHARVKLAEKTRKAVVRCRKTVEDLVAEGQLIYGYTATPPASATSSMKMRCAARCS
jgi:hypothetical protein